MSASRRLLQVLLATASGFCFTMFAICAIYSWDEANLQHWSAAGYGWLGPDFWSRSWEIKEALAGAALTFVLAMAGAFAFQKSEFVLFRLLRGSLRVAGHPIAVLVFAALAFALPKAYASVTRPDAPAQAPNLLYVLVDTWRADHVGWLGYERPVTPQLDELVRSGVVFENVVSSAGWTKPAVGTQFTGLIPSVHGAVSQPIYGLPVAGTRLARIQITWMEVLRAQGWETAVWSNNPNILPNHGFGQGVAHFYDYVNHPDRVGGEQSVEGFDPGRAEYMLPDVEEWLDAHATGDKPFAAYVHLMDPHYPYVAPEPFRGTFDKTGLGDRNLDGTVCGDWVKGKLTIEDFGPEVLERINAIYDEEILYTDTYLAPFLKKVREEHPNTIVILVSDHGEEFLEHGQLGHGQGIYNELVNVPLVIWGPNIEADRISWQVPTFDLYATLLDLLGVEQRHKQGFSSLSKSLFEPIGDHRMAWMESGGDERPPWHWRAVSDGNWKVIERLDNRPDQMDNPVEEFNTIWPIDSREAEFGSSYKMLYHIAVDPFERNDLIKQDLARATALKNRTSELLGEKFEWWFGTDHIFDFATSGGAPVDPALLQQLGYLEVESDH